MENLHKNGGKSRFRKKRKNIYLKTSSLVRGSGRMVGTSGGSFNGLPLLAAKIVVAWTSDSTKNECQCVCARDVVCVCVGATRAKRRRNEKEKEKKLH